MKQERLLAITMMLLSRPRVSAQEMAERFEVSLRTVYRDMETLGQSGIPIISFPGADGGYELMERYRLDRQMLSLEELQSMIIALQGLHASLPEEQLRGLLDKVGALLTRAEQKESHPGTSPLRIDLNPWRSGGGEQEKLTLLRQAIREKSVVSFGYINNVGDCTVRFVEPIGVVLKGYVWYLYGYCRLREEKRIFRLTRIRDLALTPEAFSPRDSASVAELDLRWGYFGSLHGTKLQPIVLHIAKPARAMAEDYFTPEQIEIEPDGSLWVRAEQPIEPWLITYLLSYGTHCRVVQPASLAEAVRDTAAAVAAQYTEHFATAVKPLI